MATFDKRNDKWRVRVRRSGKVVSKTFNFKIDAELWAREIESKVDEAGEAVFNKAKDKTTLSILIQKYLEEVSVTKKGHARERNRLLQWQKEPLADKKIYDITSSDIAAVRDRMLLSGKSASTIKNYLAPISAMFSHASSEWGFSYLINPVKGIKKPPKDPSRDIRLTKHERGIILQIPADHTRLIAIFAMETSARLLEICKLEKSAVDVVNRTALVHDKVGQGKGVLKRLPLTKRALAVIAEAEELYPDSAYVFCDDPDAMAKRVSDLWRSNKEKWGFRKEVWFKDLRHEAISTFFEKGLSVTEVMSITGHTNPSQLSTYVLHLHQKDMASRLD